MSAALENSETRLVRFVAAVALLGAAAWLGTTAAQILLQQYTSWWFGSFGFQLNFGLFNLGEPQSSWFVLVFSAIFVWGACSLLRRSEGLRLGAIVGLVALFLLLAAWLSTF